MKATTMDAQEIHLAKIANSPFCVDVVDGQHVHNDIAVALQHGGQVAVSFSGVERLTTAFLNAAIGQLYNEFPEDVIHQKISFIHTTPVQHELVRRVMDRARMFFSAQRG